MNPGSVRMRKACALLFTACALVLAIPSAFAAGVSDEASLSAALGAAVSGEVILYDAGVSSVTITSDLVIPAGVTLNLNAPQSGTLVIAGGTTRLYGAIAGGAVSVQGGTLIKQTGASLTGALSTSGSGSVREARTLSLENLAAGSGEVIQSIVYAGVSSPDTSAFIAASPAGVIYPLSGRVVEQVTTYDASAQRSRVYRFGSRNTAQLSLVFSIVYNGVQGASFSAANPTSYTSADSAIILVNPTKQGYAFAGWTCAALSITEEMRAVVPEGTAGDLVFAASWTQQQTNVGGRGGLSGIGDLNGLGGSRGEAATAADAEPDETDAAQEAPADQTANADAAGGARIGRGKSSTKVAFTHEPDAALPLMQTAQAQAPFPWGLLMLLAVGGAAIVGATALLLHRRERRKR